MGDKLRAAAQAILDSWDSGHFFTTGHADRIGNLRAALAEPEPRNQCAETCERAKLCAACARGLE